MTFLKHDFIQIKKLTTPPLNKISFYIWIYFTVKSIKYVLIISVFLIFFSNLKLYVDLLSKDRIEINLSNSLDPINIINSFKARSVGLLNALQNPTRPNKRELAVMVILRYIFILIFSYSLKTFKLAISLYNRIKSEWGELRWKKKIRFSVYLRFIHKIAPAFIFQDLINAPLLLPKEIELGCFGSKKIIIFNYVWK